MLQVFTTGAGSGYGVGARPGATIRTYFPRPWPGTQPVTLPAVLTRLTAHQLFTNCERERKERLGVKYRRIAEPLAHAGSPIT